MVAVGALLPTTPLAHTLGFQPLPGAFFGALVVMVLGYVALIEVGKRIFYRAERTTPTKRSPCSGHRHLRRRLAYFSTAAHRTGTPSARP